ncbi:PREDICTED: uncharacterized protein LOC109209791 [Nicotiana attenuata]|uniref:uncharacterized protein LOC109209791 n=1 Tax=Nicotiana attenuata TaxID=49451 RepID=UPI0009058D3A|nr:PREDICTED: uncharacterized protein LOC109209791 [Nicotiana attenuata]
MGKSNGTVIPVQATTVNPGLGNVYEMQFKLMQAAITTIEQAKENELSNEQLEQAIVPRESGDLEEVPMESGTDKIMQLHLNVPLRTPLQHLHDLVTHNVVPIDEEILGQNTMEDEGDDESTVENFKQVAREGDQSPTASAKGGLPRVRNMNKEHNFCVVALMEPFQKKGFINRYRRRLNMETAYANINGQIWLFFDSVVEWELVEDTKQQVTVEVFHHELGQHMMITFVYAKSSAMERLQLWDHLYYLASDMELPWLVGGDFNVVLHKDEKIGGLPVHPPEYENFAFCVNSCGLFEQGYKGSPFTWWNGRPNAQCIFKRLDRIFVNLPFQNMLPTIEVEHLIRTGSDHAPLLMTCGEQTEVVKQNWEADFIGDPFLIFKQKLKKVKAALSKRSRDTFGDIFKQLAILEDIVKVKEMLFEEEPTIENRFVLQKARLELKKYLSIEEQYWKQKAGLNWFAEGDRNTSFFHNHVNGKRKKLQLKRIQNSSGVWIENQEQMADVANMELSRLPTFEKVEGAVFELSGESAGGPGGFTGLFYQSCWDIVGRDIHNMVMHFYGGATLPKSITHTNLVLLLKKLRVETFSDLRPTSLSNFTSKVLSGVLHDRLKKFLPLLISPNQSGFVKGRSIFENILLTQEIVTDIRLRGKPVNVVIKLDMAKAYDRVSWKYLLHVLRRMGFSEHFINMVWNLVSNNWYSVLVNGQASGFFKSTRGVKQGDPLSPALFILSVEVLSRSLNKLFDDKSFVGFGMPKWFDP